MIAFGEGLLAGVWTALPGIVQSFDPGKQTASVQVALQFEQALPDGSSKIIDGPLLVDCPVYFPRGGGVVLTFPLAKGDECLVVFASRCIDSWWQNGGTQPQAEYRMHDLSDGFVFAGFSSVPRVPGGIATDAVELRSVANDCKVLLRPSTKEVWLQSTGAEIKLGPNRVDINAPLYINGEAYTAHKHTGVTVGGGLTGGKA